MLEAQPAFGMVLWKSYDPKLKLMVINYAKKTNNCNVERKFSLVESNVQWRTKQTKKLI
jgi:hypothetical protein